MSQNATLTPFSVPMPTISHFVVLGFALKNQKKAYGKHL